MAGSILKSCLRVACVGISGRLQFGGFRLGACRLLAHILNSPIRRHNIGDILVVLFQLHKVGNVEEGVAFQPDVNKGRLHARKDSGYAAFVDGAR